MPSTPLDEKKRSEKGNTRGEPPQWVLAKRKRGRTAVAALLSFVTLLRPTRDTARRHRNEKNFRGKRKRGSSAASRAPRRATQAPVQKRRHCSSKNVYGVLRTKCGRNRELRCRCSRSFSFLRKKEKEKESSSCSRLLLLPLLLGRLQGRLGLDLLALDEQVLDLLELYHRFLQERRRDRVLLRRRDDLLVVQVEGGESVRVADPLRRGPMLQAFRLQSRLQSLGSVRGGVRFCGHRRGLLNQLHHLLLGVEAVNELRRAGQHLFAGVLELRSLRKLLKHPKVGVGRRGRLRLHHFREGVLGGEATAEGLRAGNERLVRAAHRRFVDRLGELVDPQ